MVLHIRQRYLAWLKETKQLGIAGAFTEADGDLHKAIDYYLEAGLPGKAAKGMVNPIEIYFSAHPVARPMCLR